MKTAGYESADSRRLDDTFTALADPTRRKILSLLADGDRSVSELAKPFAISQPAVSKHLKVLERAGLISRSRDAQRRPARLEVETFLAAGDWFADYRKALEQRFNRLDSLLEKMKSAKPREETADE